MKSSTRCDEGIRLTVSSLIANHCIIDFRVIRIKAKIIVKMPRTIPNIVLWEHFLIGGLDEISYLYSVEIHYRLVYLEPIIVKLRNYHNYR